MICFSARSITAAEWMSYASLSFWRVCFTRLAIFGYPPLNSRRSAYDVCELQEGLISHLRSLSTILVAYLRLSDEILDRSQRLYPVILIDTVLPVLPPSQALAPAAPTSYSAALYTSASEFRP